MHGIGEASTMLTSNFKGLAVRCAPMARAIARSPVLISLRPKARAGPVVARSSSPHVSQGSRTLCSSSRAAGTRGSPLRPSSSSSSLIVGLAGQRGANFLPVCAMHKEAEWIMTEEQQQFWEPKLEQLQRPQAIEAAAQLNLAYPLGIPDLSRHRNRVRQRTAGSDQEDAAGSVGRPSKIPPCWELYKKSKLQHPDAIALIRIGAFYEAIGLDAVMLVEHCGLNPMGGLRRDVTRAGCPEANVQPLLKQLAQQAGLSVAVWEEITDADTPYGLKSTEAKTRRMLQLVTPEDPLYRHAYAASIGDINVSAACITGVAQTTSGLTLLDYSRAGTTVLVFNGMNEDAMWGLLQQRAGDAPRAVWLHQNPHDVPGLLAELQKRLVKEGVKVRKFCSADPLQGFQAELKQHLALHPDTVIEFSPGFSYMDWPGVRPSYQSTLCQLGLIKTSGIPALQTHLLLEGAPTVLRELMARILWLPPSHSAAAATRRAVRQLMGHDGRLPGFKAVTHMVPDRVQLVLSVEQPSCNETFFQRLAEVLGPVRSSLNPSGRAAELAQLVDNMWPLLCHLLGSDEGRLSQAWVLQGVQAAQAAIGRVVADPAGPSSTAADDDIPGACWSDKQALQAVRELAGSQDNWSRKVIPDVVARELEAAEDARLLLLQVLMSLLRHFRLLAKSTAVQAHQDYAKLLDVKADTANCAVWIKLPNTRLMHHLEKHSWMLPQELWPSAQPPLTSLNQQQAMRRPFGRDGSPVKLNSLYTCDLLEEALNRYRSAVAALNTAASRHIAQLAMELQPIWPQLAAAVQFSILAATLSNHATAALQAGWNVPLVGPEEQEQYQQQQQQASKEKQRQQQEAQAAGTAAVAAVAADPVSSGGNGSSPDSSVSIGELGCLKLEGLWPYWMPGSSGCTVKNSVALDGFALLTGPNMAGKSTILRTVAAAALCGSCGLAIPAAPGSMLPLLDAVMLRTFSGDAPTDGLSAFGVEMREMKSVLSDATHRSLVLIDELGKGTEVMSGTALSSAILQHLMDKGALGVFATHLHLLLKLLPKGPRMAFRRMEVMQQGSHSVPTWRMLEGSCTSSLAFDVAAQLGLPEHVLDLAQQQLDAIHGLGGYDAIIRLSAAGRTGDTSASGSDSDDGSSSSFGNGNRRAARASGSDSDDGSCSESDNGSSSNSDGSGSRRRGPGRPRKPAQHDSAAAAAVQQEAAAAGGHTSAAETAAAARRAAAENLRQQVSLVQQRLTQLARSTIPSSSSSSGGGALARGVAAGVVHHLPDLSYMPPPAHAGLGVLYVLRFPDGRFYAGETEDIARRREEHRRRWARRHGGPPEVWYAVLGDQGNRKALESQLIMELATKKLDMLSLKDAARARRA